MLPFAPLQELKKFFKKQFENASFLLFFNIYKTSPTNEFKLNFSLGNFI